MTWKEAIQVLSERSGMKYVGIVGTSFRAYKLDEAWFLEVASESATNFEIALRLKIFGDYFEDRDGEFARVWTKTVDPFCMDLLEEGGFAV